MRTPKTGRIRRGPPSSEHRRRCVAWESGDDDVDGGQHAQRVHRLFADHFGIELPLVLLDVDAHEPFRLM